MVEEPGESAPLTLVFGSALASTENLGRFVSLLLTASLDLSEDSRDHSDEVYLQREQVDISSHDILRSLFRNAQFWELHNIRGLSLRRLARFGLSLIHSRISIICVDPDCTTLPLLFSHCWDRAAFA